MGRHGGRPYLEMTRLGDPAYHSYLTPAPSADSGTEATDKKSGLSPSNRVGLKMPWPSLPKATPSLHPALAGRMIRQKEPGPS
jgi:hypothetical protein